MKTKRKNKHECRIQKKSQEAKMPTQEVEMIHQELRNGLGRPGNTLVWLCLCCALLAALAFDSLAFVSVDGPSLSVQSIVTGRNNSLLFGAPLGNASALWAAPCADEIPSSAADRASPAPALRAWLLAAASNQTALCLGNWVSWLQAPWYHTDLLCWLNQSDLFTTNLMAGKHSWLFGCCVFCMFCLCSGQSWRDTCAFAGMLGMCFLYIPNPWMSVEPLFRFLGLMGIYLLLGCSQLQSRASSSRKSPRRHNGTNQDLWHTSCFPCVRWQDGVLASLVGFSSWYPTLGAHFCSCLWWFLFMWQRMAAGIAQGPALHLRQLRSHTQRT